MSGKFEGHVLLSTEAELYVQTLQTFDIKDIGSQKWRQQHEYLEKLNMQAVLSASRSEDEFIKEYLITYEKIQTLVHELIATEIWKQKVFPEFIELDLEPDLLFPLYIVLYHEATVVNLLETALFHSDACEAADDCIIDLIDYTYRKLTYLATREAADDEDDADVRDSNSIASASSLKELDKQRSKLQFDISIKCVSIFRYITDHLATLPLSATSRILTAHDFPILIVQLVETSPWMKQKSGKLMKFVDSKWQTVEYEDRHRLTKTEGQVWITVFQLLLSEETRTKYELNSFRKNSLLKLRTYLTDVLLDQMPVLSELQRYLEQLSIMEPPAIKSELILEQLPVMFDGMRKQYNGKWKQLAKQQSETHFNPKTSDWKQSAAMLAETYSLDVLENLIAEPPKCAVCGELAAKRCSRCQNEWYCRRECQVKHWPKHNKICDLMVDDGKVDETQN